MHSRVRSFVLQLGLLLAVALWASPVTAAASPQILVGANVLVSQDINAPHHECSIVVDPRNPKHILGAVTTVARTGEDMFDKTWVSFDGGFTWDDAIPPGSLHRGGGDPFPGFGPSGTAYFVTLLYDHSMHFYRSPDGGRSWGQPVFIARQDGEQQAVDWTFGPHRGRIYVWGEGRDPSNRFPGPTAQLWRSDNDGRSFFGPKIVASGRLRAKAPFIDQSVGAENLAVLSDGTLVVAYVRFAAWLHNKTLDRMRLTVAVSKDGGDTFSAEHMVGDGFIGNRDRDLAGFAAVVKGDLTQDRELSQFAADRSAGAHRDRLYAAWSDRRYGPVKQLFSYSTDRGVTWSQPKTIGCAPQDHYACTQPALAVNNQGVLGFFYYRVPGVAGSKSSFDAYFTASLDGGQTFLAPRRVTTETSFPRSPGNFDVRVDWKSQSKDDQTAYLFTPYGYHAMGGDYIGMAAGNDGVFHPLWTDSRSGTYQLYTAAITVAEPAAPDAGPTQLLDDQVAAVFDPISCDYAGDTCDVPIRLHNTSHHAIAGPITLTLKKAESSGFARSTSAAFTLLNAPNGAKAAGAIYDYSNALGDLAVLPPGALSNPVMWKFHFRDFAGLSAQLHFDIRGRVVK